MILETKVCSIFFVGQSWVNGQSDLLRIYWNTKGGVILLHIKDVIPLKHLGSQNVSNKFEKGIITLMLL